MINYLLPSKSATVQSLGHPAAGVIGWLDSSANNSGVAVTQQSALTMAAVWCAVRVISETIATLPCILYRRTSDDGRERATDDPRYTLIHDEPHPEMSAVSFFDTQTANLVLRGNSYAEIAWNATLPSRLYIRRPDSVRVEIDGDRVVYEVVDPRETIQSRNMLHVAGLGGDGIVGWSVIEYARQSIGSGLAADQFAAGMWGNGATPNGVLTHPMRLDKDAREKLRREWDETHRGSSNAGKIAIMHGGMEFKPISMTNEDAQFLESRQFSVREIARWFRLPPHMLADLADSSVRANIEQQAIEFIVYSLKPWLVRWQQTLNRKLLEPSEREAMYFEFLLESLLQGDSAAQSAAFSIGRQWGWLSVNDIRRKMNMPVIDGGDAYLQPANMVEIGEDEEEDDGLEMQLEPIQQEAPPEPADRVPAALVQEMQSNLAQSLNAILDSGKALRDDLEAGGLQVHQAIGHAEVMLQGAVDDIRGAREEIRQDISQVGRTVQVQGWSAERDRLAEVCEDLVRSHLRCAVRMEKANVIEAANLACRGENFVAWLDRYYNEHPERIVDRIRDPVACFEKLQSGESNGAANDLATDIAATHKAGLLECCDGDPAGLVERVQSYLDTWDAEIAALKLEGTEHVS